MIAQDFICCSTHSERHVLWRNGVVIQPPDGITSDLAAVFCSLVEWLCKAKTSHGKQKTSEGARHKFNVSASLTPIGSNEAIHEKIFNLQA